MAGEVRGGRRHGGVSPAASGGQQALGRREGRPGLPPQGPRAAAGGVPADRRQGEGGEGGAEGARVQDAAGCEWQSQRAPLIG